jgi:hypothetical protein
MAATRSQPTVTGPANGAVAKAKEAGDAVTTAARRAPAGALARQRARDRARRPARSRGRVEGVKHR